MSNLTQLTVARNTMPVPVCQPPVVYEGEIVFPSKMTLKPLRYRPSALGQMRKGAARLCFLCSGMALALSWAIEALTIV